MKNRTMFVTLTLWFAAAAICFVQAANTGTWKLNEEKSSLQPGMVKNTTIIIALAGTPEDKEIKITTNAVGKHGKPVPQRVWVGKRDGKFYAVETSKTYDSVAYTAVNKKTSAFTAKKGDKVVMTGTVTVDYRDKSRVVTMVGKYANGKSFKNVEVYDKQ